MDTKVHSNSCRRKRFQHVRFGTYSREAGTSFDNDCTWSKIRCKTISWRFLDDFLTFLEWSRRVPQGSFNLIGRSVQSMRHTQWHAPLLRARNVANWLPAPICTTQLTYHHWTGIEIKESTQCSIVADSCQIYPRANCCRGEKTRSFKDPSKILQGPWGSWGQAREPHDTLLVRILQGEGYARNPKGSYRNIKERQGIMKKHRNNPNGTSSSQEEAEN
jgi:hypothetical protein